MPSMVDHHHHPPSESSPSPSSMNEGDRRLLLLAAVSQREDQMGTPPAEEEESSTALLGPVRANFFSRNFSVSKALPPKKRHLSSEPITNTGSADPTTFTLNENEDIMAQLRRNGLDQVKIPPLYGPKEPPLPPVRHTNKKRKVSEGTRDASSSGGNLHSPSTAPSRSHNFLPKIVTGGSSPHSTQQAAISSSTSFSTLPAPPLLGMNHLSGYRVGSQQGRGAASMQKWGHDYHQHIMSMSMSGLSTPNRMLYMMQGGPTQQQDLLSNSFPPSLSNLKGRQSSKVAGENGVIDLTQHQQMHEAKKQKKALSSDQGVPLKKMNGVNYRSKKIIDPDTGRIIVKPRAATTVQDVLNNYTSTTKGGIKDVADTHQDGQASSRPSEEVESRPLDESPFLMKALEEYKIQGFGNNQVTLQKKIANEAKRAALAQKLSIHLSNEAEASVATETTKTDDEKEESAGEHPPVSDSKEKSTIAPTVNNAGGNTILFPNQELYSQMLRKKDAKKKMKKDAKQLYSQNLRKKKVSSKPKKPLGVAEAMAAVLPFYNDWKEYDEERRRNAASSSNSAATAAIADKKILVAAAAASSKPSAAAAASSLRWKPSFSVQNTGFGSMHQDYSQDQDDALLLQSRLLQMELMQERQQEQLQQQQEQRRCAQILQMELMHRKDLLQQQQQQQRNTPDASSEHKLSKKNKRIQDVSSGSLSHKPINVLTGTAGPTDFTLNENEDIMVQLRRSGLDQVKIPPLSSAKEPDKKKCTVSEGTRDASTCGGHLHSFSAASAAEAMSRAASSSKSASSSFKPSAAASNPSATATAASSLRRKPSLSAQNTELGSMYQDRDESLMIRSRLLQMEMMQQKHLQQQKQKQPSSNTHLSLPHPAALAPTARQITQQDPTRLSSQESQDDPNLKVQLSLLELENQVRAEEHAFILQSNQLRVAELHHQAEQLEEQMKLREMEFMRERRRLADMQTVNRLRLQADELEKRLMTYGDRA